MADPVASGDLPRWVEWGSTVATAVIAGWLAAIWRGFQTGKWSVEIDTRKDIAELRDQMRKAGEHMSDLATDVQGMPERLRADFVLKQIFEIERAIAKERHDALRQEMHAEHDKLWQSIRQFQRGPRSPGHS